MNKLTALSKLANAYHSLSSRDGSDLDAQLEISDKFNYIRRSLRIQDLKPQPKCTEGYNGRMPTQL